MCSSLAPLLISELYICGMNFSEKILERPKDPIQEYHDSGINAFFRVMSNNLSQQNILADNKANIMISINTVVLSLVIGSAARNVEFWQNLLVPIILFVITALMATIFAVLATSPRFVEGKLSNEDFINKRTSVLFFGFFTSLKLNDFENNMITVLKDDEYLYRCILADFHGQGQVLKRKYRMLRYSYAVFLVGLIISIGSFVVSFYFQQT